MFESRDSIEAGLAAKVKASADEVAALEKKAKHYQSEMQTAQASLRDLLQQERQSPVPLLTSPTAPVADLRHCGPSQAHKPSIVRTRLYSPLVFPSLYRNLYGLYPSIRALVSASSLWRKLSIPLRSSLLSKQTLAQSTPPRVAD